MIDQEQQRDHADEAATRAELESEGRAELEAEQFAAAFAGVNATYLAYLLGDIEAADQDYARRYGLVLTAVSVAAQLGYAAGFGIDRQPGEEWEGFRTVAYIELPTGQVSWHMPEHAKPWDGHDTAEKYRRCRTYDPDYGRAAMQAGSASLERDDDDGRADYVHEQPDDRAEYDDPPAVGTNCC